MTTGELIGNARNFALRTLGKTKTLALVFLGIRKARVNRQDASRIAVTRSVREQQALARRPPQVALHAAGGLVLTQQLAIAHETVTGQLNLVPVRCLAPLIERHHQRVVVMQAHLVQPYQSNGKAPLHGHRAPQALSFAHRCRPHHA